MALDKNTSIKVVNNFAELNHLDRLLDQASWTYGYYPGLQGDDYPSWHVHFCGDRTAREKSIHDNVLEMKPGLEALSELWKLIKNDLAPEYGLMRVYANAQTFGLEGNIHHNAKPSDEELVALLYVNTEWKETWAGETIFYDPSRECISIRPRPGRLVLFDGSISHASRAPSRDCPTLCRTVLFHMKRIH